MNDNIIDYVSAGVDVHAGEAAVDSIRELVKHSYNGNVLSDLGSFGGLYRFDKDAWQDPILVSSTDGVGTKLRVAILAQRYDTVGQDLVNHCVNDILVQGAVPLFFLDYIGLEKLHPEQVHSIISGMVKACRENACALIGGEMAEMPGIYREPDFDLVGTIIGVVDKGDLLPGNRIRSGDIVIGFPSSGLHTNGYSLARKIVFDHLGLTVDSLVGELNATVGDLLLSVHRSYLAQLRPFLKDPRLHGLAHITGGGIPGNLKRIIPEGLTAYISYSDSEYPPLFRWLQSSAGLEAEVMRQAFNLGIGMVAVADPELGPALLAAPGSVVIGEIDETMSGDGKVAFIH